MTNGNPKLQRLREVLCGELADRGTATEMQLHTAVRQIYRRAGETFDSNQWRQALAVLVSGGSIEKRPARGGSSRLTIVRMPKPRQCAGQQRMF